MRSRPRSGSFGSLALLVLAMGAAGCAGGSSGATGTGGSKGAGGTSPTGGSTDAGGTTGAGGTVTTGGATGTGGASATGGTTGAGGTVATGGAGGSNATGGAPGTGGTSATGTGGASATGGTIGTGGASATGGTTGTGGSSATGGAGGCPSDATFCSGFESPGLPTGAVYMANAGPGDWSRDFAVDTAQQHSGSSSLRVKIGESGATGAYQMLAVPATPTAFWARFWIMSSIDLGGTEHNAFAGASVGSGTNDVMIEFAEDSGIAFNTKDQDCFPTVGCTGQHPTTPYTIPGMTWQCVEISFSASGQVQQLYVSGSLLIDAQNYPGSTVVSSTPYFKFGYDAYHPDVKRQLWYDDVVVAPTRVGGCQ